MNSRFLGFSFLFSLAIIEKGEERKLFTLKEWQTIYL